MKGIIFAVFGITSIVWLLFWAIYVYRYHKRGKNRNVPTLMLVTIGVFLSAWMFDMAYIGYLVYYQCFS